MGMVNKVDAGQGMAQASGGLAQLAATTVASRSNRGGGAVATSNDSQGVQGALPGMQPGKGKEWIGQQNEKRVIENSIIQQRQDVSLRLDETEARIQRAVRDGRYDLEEVAREELQGFAQDIYGIDKKLLAHQFMSGLHDEMFSVPKGGGVIGADGLTVTDNKSAMHQNIINAYKDHQTRSEKTYSTALNSTLDSLQMSVLNVMTNLTGAETMKSASYDRAHVAMKAGTDMYNPALGVIGSGVSRAGDWISKTLTGRDMAGQTEQDYASAASGEARSMGGWVDEWARDFGTNFAAQAKGTGKESLYTDAFRSFGNGLYEYAQSTYSSDPKDAAHQASLAKVVANSISNLKSLGVTDTQLAGIRRGFGSMGKNMILAMDQERRGLALGEAQMSSDQRRQNAMRGIDPVAGEEMARTMKIMGGSLAELKKHIPESEWKKEYGIPAFTSEEFDGSWMQHTIPEIVGEFMAAGGSLDTEKAQTLMNKFDAPTQKAIRRKFETVIRGAEAEIEQYGGNTEGMSLFADNSGAIESLNTERAGVQSEAGDMRLGMKRAQSMIGDRAKTKMFSEQAKVLDLIQEGDTRNLVLSNQLSPDMVQLFEKILSLDKKT